MSWICSFPNLRGFYSHESPLLTRSVPAIPGSLNENFPDNKEVDANCITIIQQFEYHKLQKSEGTSRPTPSVSSSWPPIHLNLYRAGVAQIVKKLTTSYGTRNFIKGLIRFRHWSLSWARHFQSITFHTISLKFILLLYPVHAYISQVVS
jgi:hypothetical protein